MFSSVVTAVTDRLDSQFLIAFWLPAFVAMLSGGGLLVARVGVDEAGDWINTLDSVQQTLLLVIVVLAVTMMAFVLKSLRLPVTDLYAGSALPGGIARWMTRAQRRARDKAAKLLQGAPEQPTSARGRLLSRHAFSLYYPSEEADTQPTLFGNVLAAAAEHPRLIYAMDGVLWWPRLMPLLPGEFGQMLSGAQAPMMALLNLSVVFAALGLAGGIVLALGGALWPTAVIVLVAGFVLCRLCYLAAVSQAVEVGNLMGVGFDLYRHAILGQLGVANPSDLTAERALWQTLTAEMFAAPETLAELGRETVLPADPPPVEASRVETTSTAG